MQRSLRILPTCDTTLNPAQISRQFLQENYYNFFVRRKNAVYIFYSSNDADVPVRNLYEKKKTRAGLLKNFLVRISP